MTVIALARERRKANSENRENSGNHISPVPAQRQRARVSSAEFVLSTKRGSRRHCGTDIEVQRCSLIHNERELPSQWATPHALKLEKRTLYLVRWLARSLNLDSK